MQSLEIDFRPEGDPRDLKTFKDTAWQVEEKFLGNGYKPKLISMKSTRFYKTGPFHKLIGVAEYYLDGYHDIFASHFGRGTTLGRAKYRKGWKKRIYAIPKVGGALIRSKGKREKKKWIKICRKIINKQS